MLRRYIEVVVAFPRLTVAVVFLLTMVFASQLGSLETVLDPKRMLPQDHPYVQLNNEIERRFGGSRVVVIGVVARQGTIFTPAILAKVQRITEAVKTAPGILEGQVVSLADRKIKAIHATRGGLTVRRMMAEVPQTPDAIAALKTDLFANPMYIGTLVSPDGRAAAVITDFRGGAAFEGMPRGSSGGGPAGYAESPPSPEGGKTESDQHPQGNKWWKPGQPDS